MKEKTTVAKKPEMDLAKEKSINTALAHMKHKDLQRECVLRGLQFEKIVEFDHHALSNWFYHNFESPSDLARLTLYDIWMEEQLQAKGYKKGDAALAPCFRLGFTPDLESITPKTPGVQKQIVQAVDTQPKEVKPKRVVDAETGVYSGTKKNLTYKLTDEGMELDKIVEKVLELFPEAQEKSIKIWHKRRLNETK